MYGLAPEHRANIHLDTMKGNHILSANKLSSTAQVRFNGCK